MLGINSCDQRLESKFPQAFFAVALLDTAHNILHATSCVSGVPGTRRSSLRHMQASAPRPQLRNCVMPFKVQVGPQQVSIHQGQTVLVSEPDGQINWPSEKGLYFLDTRVISSWTIYANGEPWELAARSPTTHRALI
jgi:glycogen debranching enzyme-like protein